MSEGPETGSDYFMKGLELFALYILPSEQFSFLIYVMVYEERRFMLYVHFVSTQN